MRTVVTGACGFIGSTLTELLLERGDSVVAVDCLTDNYEPAVKAANLNGSSDHPRLRLVDADLVRDPLEPLFDDVDAIFHLAGQPGVRPSWAEHFGLYVDRNIVATQRVLEAARRVRSPRIVAASSSSVYGRARRYPTTEDDLPAPHSPYGVTKLAAEHLCRLYADNFALPTVALRYFTVYGPRQRPDMAFHRLIAAALEHRPFPLLGTGHQRRDFTFVEDAARATLLAAVVDVPPGSVLNVSGANASLLEAVALVEDLTGSVVRFERGAAPPGDVDRTGGSSARARALLGWEPQVDLSDGLAEQARWQRSRLRSAHPIGSNTGGR
jgi:UDP-glucuronate 4-epimerase